MQPGRGDGAPRDQRAREDFDGGKSMTELDPKLREFCTVRQLEIFEALEDHGSERKAADALGIARGTIRAAMIALRKKAALKGYSPEHHMTRTVPDGMVLKGVSSYFNKDGALTGQWVKSSADADRQRAIYQAAADAMAEELPRVAPIVPPAHANGDLATVYTL